MSTTHATTHLWDRNRDYYAAINRSLRESGITPPHSIVDSMRLRRDRSSVAHDETRSRSTPETRLRAQILRTYIPEIRRRGWDTTIDTGGAPALLGVRERRPRGATRMTWSGDLVMARYPMYLLSVSGYHRYSARQTWHATITYLCGEADNGPWAARVPGSCTSIDEALDWLEPAEVRRARDRGLRVKRQGDVYAIEMTRDRAGVSARHLPRHHRWDEERRTLYHRPEIGRRHRAMRIPWPTKFVMQRSMADGCGD